MAIQEIHVHVHCHHGGHVDHTEQLDRMEQLMTTEAEKIGALGAKVDDLIGDVRAALAALEADRDNLGPEGQAALDTLNAKVDAFDAEVGEHDGSGTPPVEPTDV